MIQASRTLSAAPFRSAFPHPHRARFFVPPVDAVSLAEPAPARWIGREDVLFFASCYAAGLVFFLIMLS